MTNLVLDVFDINVSPDKRMIMLHNETGLITSLKVMLRLLLVTSTILIFQFRLHSKLLFQTHDQLTRSTTANYPKTIQTRSGKTILRRPNSRLKSLRPMHPGQTKRFALHHRKPSPRLLRRTPPRCRSRLPNSFFDLNHPLRYTPPLPPVLR
jgi:DNA mismatch repair ATPase MutL